MTAVASSSGTEMPIPGTARRSDEQVHFPDVRIEYEDASGDIRWEDVEVTTEHYCRRSRRSWVGRGTLRVRHLQRPKRRRWRIVRSARGGGLSSMTLPTPPENWNIGRLNTERMQAVTAFGFTERQARF